MVILVNDNDQPIGQMEKLQAHKEGALHRAFSVLVFNSDRQLLLQQRALHKYHTPGKWTNTCCSHQRMNESTLDAANRRLMEEMGMHTPLKFLFKFTYMAPFDKGLTEHEIDHVVIGFSDTKPVINPDEVMDYKYMSVEDIRADMVNNPDAYTPWFKIILQQYADYINNLTL